MARYRMEDNTVVDTDNAREGWNEKRHFDGHNMVGNCSCSPWHTQTLHCSRKGRYYIEYESRVQGERDRAEWVSPQEAARWLLLNEIELPDDLKAVEDDVLE